MKHKFKILHVYMICDNSSFFISTYIHAVYIEYKALLCVEIRTYEESKGTWERTNDSKQPGNKVTKDLRINSTKGKVTNVALEKGTFVKK
jgi:hypothetical protein